MKRIAMLAVAAAIAMGSLTTVTTPTLAKGGKPWQTRICQHHVKIGTFKNMGECMKRIQTNAERYCSYLEGRGYFDRPDARWKSKEECKRWYRQRR